MSNEERSVEMVNEYPHSIELNRGMKGDYGWSIKIRFRGETLEDEETGLRQLSYIDQQLRAVFLDGLPNDHLEQKLADSIAALQASQPTRSPNPDAPTRKRVVIAETLDKRVNERLAAEITKRGTPQ